MAITPLTNKHVVSKENFNRGKQTSTRSQVNRGGNDRQSVVPGKDFS